jgi:hypothetical protein
MQMFHQEWSGRLIVNIDHPSASIGEVDIALPWIFMACCLIKHRDNFFIVRHEIGVALSMKAAVFCDMTQWNLVKFTDFFSEDDTLQP